MGIELAILGAVAAGSAIAGGSVAKHQAHKKEKKARAAAEEQQRQQRQLAGKNDDSMLTQKQMLQGNQNILGNSPTSTGGSGASRGRLVNV